MKNKCFLLTNGRGGFCALSHAGTVERGDHALLMSAARCPNERRHLVTNVLEVINIEGTSYELLPEYIKSSSFEGAPQWIYKIEDVYVVKTVTMAYGEDTVALRYEVTNEHHRAVELAVTPLIRFTGKNDEFENAQEYVVEASEQSAHITGAVDELFVATTGQIKSRSKQIEGPLHFPLDACDGRCEKGNVASVLDITFSDPEVCEIVFSTQPVEAPSGYTARLVMENMKRQNLLLAKASSCLNTRLEKRLIKSADAFVVRRDSTNGMTIVAGYPFFGDWGRDTMIALPGTTLVTGRFDDCKSILLTFDRYIRNGLLPNLFPEGDDNPMYNSIDAPLLYINGVHLYEEFSNDKSLAVSLYPGMKAIIQSYMEGTDFHIKMDEADGLILGGQGTEQLTWMDVCVEGHCPTPRHGKPVEINAYWYNALMLMSEIARRPEIGDKTFAEELETLAQKVKKSFVSLYWNEDSKCLKDVINGTYEENQIRCNQVWALALPYTMLDISKEKMLLATVEEKLYTSIGLRTLSPEDEAFHEIYLGDMKARDLAYHQGTVWGYYLGIFIRAQVAVASKLAGDERLQMIAKIEQEIAAIEPWLDEGCSEQIAEIYDGKEPSVSRGCFAQAWSVGEILYGLYELERLKQNAL